MTATITFTPSEIAAYYAARVPDLKQSRGSEWRGPCPLHSGTHNNFAVHSAMGRWYCFSTCSRGGDILKLERDLTGVDFLTAKAEVFRLVGRAPEDRIPPHERRRLAWRQAAVEQAARDVVDWRRGRIAQLERMKAAVAEMDNMVALAETSSELYRLTSNGGASVTLYHAHLLRDPEGAAELVRWARRDEQHAQTVAAAVVLLLTRAEGAHGEQ